LKVLKNCRIPATWIGIDAGRLENRQDETLLSATTVQSVPPVGRLTAALPFSALAVSCGEKFPAGFSRQGAKGAGVNDCRTGIGAGRPEYGAAERGTLITESLIDSSHGQLQAWGKRSR
jgi:hypothetical protein